MGENTSKLDTPNSPIKHISLPAHKRSQTQLARAQKNAERHFARLQVIEDKVRKPWPILFSIFIYYLSGALWNVWSRLEHNGHITFSSLQYDFTLENFVKNPLLIVYLLAPIGIYLGLLNGVKWLELYYERNRNTHRFIDYKELERDYQAKTTQVPYDLGLAAAIVPAGRKETIDDLRDVIRTKNFKGVFALVGPEGIGKRTVLRYVARCLYQENRFPDGAIIVDGCTYSDRKAVLKSILSSFRSMSLDLETLASMEDYQKAIVHTLYGRKVVIVLEDMDNLNLTEIIDPLIRSQVLVIMTVRRPIPEGALFENVQTLEMPESLPVQVASMLFTKWLGYQSIQEVADADARAIGDLVVFCKCISHALYVIAKNIKSQRRDLATICRELKDDPQKVLELRDGLTPHVIRWATIESFEWLSEKQRNALTTLAAFGKPSFGRHAALQAIRAISKSNDIRDRDILESLVSRGLLRPYQKFRTAQSGNEHFERLTMDYQLWLHISARFDEWKKQIDQRYVNVYCALGIYFGENGAKYSETALLCESDQIVHVLKELRVFISSLNRAHRRSYARYCIVTTRFLAGISRLLKTQNLMPIGEGVVGKKDVLLFADAAKYACKLVKIRERKLEAAQVLHYLGVLLETLGDYREAEKLVRDSQQTRIDMGDKLGQVESFYELGRIELNKPYVGSQEPNIEIAQMYFTAGLEIAERLNDGFLICLGNYTLAVPKMALGNPTEAIARLGQADAQLDVLSKTNPRRAVRIRANILAVRAQFAVERGSFERATEFYLLAYNILDGVNEPRRAQIAFALAETYLELGALNSARKYYELAVSKAPNSGEMARRAEQALNCLNVHEPDFDDGSQQSPNIFVVLSLDGEASEFAYEGLLAHQKASKAPHASHEQVEYLLRAESLYIEAYGISKRLEDLEAQCLLFYNLSDIALLRGRVDQAQALKDASLEFREKAEKIGRPPRRKRAFGRLTASRDEDYQLPLAPSLVPISNDSGEVASLA